MPFNNSNTTVLPAPSAKVILPKPHSDATESTGLGIFTLAAILVGVAVVFWVFGAINRAISTRRERHMYATI
jgi:hypothetical protein